VLQVLELETVSGGHACVELPLLMSSSWPTSELSVSMWVNMRSRQCSTDTQDDSGVGGVGGVGRGDGGGSGGGVFAAAATAIGGFSSSPPPVPTKSVDASNRCVWLFDFHVAGEHTHTSRLYSACIDAGTLCVGRFDGKRGGSGGDGGGGGGGSGSAPMARFNHFAFKPHLWYQ
jgi:hypothetical protein